MNLAFQYQRLILAYHGCDKAVADEVLIKGSPLKSSQKSYDWSGNGIYFWEHGPERALEWAQGRENDEGVRQRSGAFLILQLVQSSVPREIMVGTKRYVSRLTSEMKARTTTDRKLEKLKEEIVKIIVRALLCEGSLNGQTVTCLRDVGSDA